MLTNRKIEIDTQHSVSKPIIYEQNEWVREKLTEIWGDNKADYFVNQNRAPRKSSTDTRSDDDIGRNLANPKNRGSRQGLYAYMIWDNLREDAGSRFKLYSLDKDLHNLNYYEKVKEKLSEDLNTGEHKKGKKKGNKENETTKLNNTYSDTMRMKKNKLFRSEIELMYRSSKMNEEKVNVMRANAPLPDMNDAEGKDSIIRYLPPIINLNNDIKAARPVNSSLEFSSSPTMRKKYKKKIDQNLALQSQVAHYSIIDTKNADKSNKAKMEIQNVKLHFLTERPAREYIGPKAIEGDENRSCDVSQSEEFQQLRIDNGPSKEPESYQDKNQGALVPYDSKSVSYPPLSMNALMEYKPLLKAPGAGEFDNGKPKLFKLVQQ